MNSELFQIKINSLKHVGVKLDRALIKYGPRKDINDNSGVTHKKNSWNRKVRRMK